MPVIGVFKNLTVVRYRWWYFISMRHLIVAQTSPHRTVQTDYSDTVSGVGYDSA